MKRQLPGIFLSVALLYADMANPRGIEWLKGSAKKRSYKAGVRPDFAASGKSLDPEVICTNRVKVGAKRLVLGNIARIACISYVK